MGDRSIPAHSREAMLARRASKSDLPLVLETLTLAFADDPVWRPSLTGPSHEPADMGAFWEIWIRGAQRYRWIWLLDGGAAVSVWIPPGGTELDPAQERELHALALSRLGDAGAAVLDDVFERFESAHPRQEEHYYLSLLGTHPDWRGRGLGMSLLRQNLDLIDSEAVPAYLESSNPVNDDRYRTAGFEPVVVFELPLGQRVTGMWREPSATTHGSA